MAFLPKSVTWRELWEREKGMARAVGKFCHSVWLKMDQDDALFLASGLAFNILMCLIPILLLLMYGFGLYFQSAESLQFVDKILKTAFPNQPHAIEIRKGISSLLSEIVANPKAFGVLSVIVLMAAATSLFSSLRSVLHRVFEVTSWRHFVISYLVDLSLVLGLTLLILLTTSLSWIYRGIKTFQEFLPGVPNLYGIVGMIPDLLSLGLVTILCYLVYRFVPVVRTPWKASIISAATTAIIWELSGRVFAFYLGSLTSINKIYGAYAFIIVTMIWVFYSSLIFVMGAEVGQVYQKSATKKKSSENPLS
jgi:membrane protein